MKWIVTYNNVLVNLNQLISIHIVNEYTTTDNGLPCFYNSVVKGVLYPMENVNIDIFQSDDIDLTNKVFEDIKTFISSNDNYITFYKE